MINLINDDCSNIAKLVKPASVDLLITSPPYNINKST